MYGGFLYETRSASWPYKFLPSYEDSKALVAVPAGSYAREIFLSRFELQNHTGGALNMGAGFRLKADSTVWQAGTVTAAGAYTDKTAEAISATVGDFPLGVVSSNGSGFLVACRTQFDLLDVIVSTAASGGAPAWGDALQYSIAVTPFWQPMIAANLYATPSFTATGENLVWFKAPIDWAPMDATNHGTGVPVGMYGMRVRQTVAGTTSPGLATQVIPAIVKPMEAQAGTVIMEWDPIGGASLSAFADALAPVFASINAGNSASASFRFR